MKDGKLRLHKEASNSQEEMSAFEELKLSLFLSDSVMDVKHFNLKR